MRMAVRCRRHRHSAAESASCCSCGERCWADGRKGIGWVQAGGSSVAIAGRALPVLPLILNASRELVVLSDAALHRLCKQ